LTPTGSQPATHGEDWANDSRLEQAVRGVPGPDARQDLGIFGDRRVTEAGIQMALVGRVEDGVEVWMRRACATLGAGMPWAWSTSSRTPPAVCDATRTSPGYAATNAVVTKAPML
jgi:hypothetical protein